jgi:hypothetical protein
MTLPRPQRLFLPSPPGSLLKRTGAADQPQQPRKSDGDADYMGLIRQLPCLSCGMEPCYEAAHVKFSSATYGKTNGLGKRPHHRFTLPLCPDDHRLAKDCQHAGSEELFWNNLGIDALATCAALYAQRGDVVAMRFVVITTIANRDKKKV